ncbi:uncharacterized protein LOC129272489 [Lytechinus pictus]|uniref:uncharacterized protein LOC129272489 n=1 Tax=Lytechinus pictus TaxID=7653 RepID=UPI0030B9BA9F
MASTTSVQNWLGQELETRGVDAVVYTRYILSIFQQDSFDLEQDPEPVVAAQSAVPPPTHNQQSKVGVEGGGGISSTFAGYHHHQALPGRKDKGKGRCKGKNHHLRWQTPEDLKKDAVVKCLQSVAEKDCGIEGLVEELCLKLKKVQEEREENATPSHSPDNNSQKSSDGASQTERYYEAFPALSDKSKAVAADIKPKGAWKSKAKRNNSTGSISNPPSDRELETLPDKSVSASVSRNSHSPVGFQGNQYQRAQSLPSSLSRNQNKSPTFVVPKYQGRKGHHRTYGHSQDKSAKRHHRDWDWGSRVDRVEGKYKNVAGWKKGDMFPEWYSESGEGQANLNLPLDGSDLEATEEASQEVFLEANGDSNEEERLEEAVNTMAETLCRSIMEECDDDKPFTKSLTIHGLLIDDQDKDMLGRGDNLKDWYAGSTRIGDFKREVSMAPIDVNGQHNLSSSMWEKNLVPGSPSCEGLQEPWENNARSCLPTASSPPSTSLSSGAPDVNHHGSDPTSPRSLLGDSALEDLSDATSLTGELRVDIDHHHMDSAPISPRNAPIGTGRNNDSLLRICDHTHAHSNPYDPQGPGTPSGWGISSDSSQGPLQSTPGIPGLPSDQSFSADDDSIVQSICSSHKDGSLLNLSSEAHSLDMNNALWATYDSKQPQFHPPKIVTWDENIFSGFQPMSKMSTFIEGGVYGSPYSSHNNSQFNSCSTSPCNDSSIRELWEASHNRDTTSSVCSLECLLSPQPCGTSCCSHQDEQSVIEDSLVDSPKYLCSRSSSRFDFARSDAENSDDSSPPGTETDEMISEDEWVEEVPRDVHDVKGDKGDQSDNDRTPKEKSPGVIHEGSLNSQQGSSANSQQGFCGNSLGSGKGTVVSQHLLSAGWKKNEGPSSASPDKSDLSKDRAELTSSSERPFISEDSHFKPIQFESKTQLLGFSSEDKVDFQPFEPRKYTRSTSNPSGQDSVSSHISGGNISNVWKPVQGSAPQMFLYGRDQGLQPSKPPEDITARSTSQTSQLHPGGFGVGKFPDSFTSTGPAPLYPNQPRDSEGIWRCTYPGGAGADIQDPGGGHRAGGAVIADNWGFYGVRPPGMQQLDHDTPLMYPDEDDTFLHEGLLVDQPLESHPPQRSQGRFKRRSGANNVCKEFLEGCCTNNMCGYSHDTSHVTCGQWLEGRCERGPFCKFLHGYTSNMSSQNSSRACSRSGSTDETEETSWDQHQRPSFPVVPDLMRLPGYQSSGGHGRSLGEGEGGEHMRSLPINISSKNR